MSYIYENKYYKVELGDSLDESSWKGGSVYSLINKDTGVIEMQHTVLPNIISYAQQFEKALDALAKEEKELDTSAKDILNA